MLLQSAREETSRFDLGTRSHGKMPLSPAGGTPASTAGACIAAALHA